MKNNQVTAIVVIALIISVIGLGAVAYTYSDSGAQAIGISHRVSTYNLLPDAVTGAKIADDAIDSEHYTDDSIDTGFFAASQITNTEMGDDSIKVAELDYEVVAVTVTALGTSGTGTCTTGSIVIGYYPTSNQDQLVDSVGVSSTTVTVTLNAAATADNVFNVVLLKA